MEERIIKILWGVEEFERSAVGSEGHSGGMLTVWKKGVIEPSFSFKDKGFLGVNVCWQGTNCNFVNVFSSCFISEKRELWRKLLDWKFKLPRGEWIVGGEFNAIKLGEERKGRSQSSGVEMEEFVKFIELMEVVDVPVIGNKLTWINSNGKASSRLVRILLSEGTINQWKVVA